MTPTRTRISVHATVQPATILERQRKRIIATDGTFVDTFSLRKSGRWVRAGDPNVWGAHRLEGV